MSNHISNDIYEKIQKLLRLAERAGTVAEAANASAKIQRLLIKYNLDIEEVNRYKKTDLCEGYDYYSNYGKNVDINLIKTLFLTIAHFHMCKLISINQNNMFIIIGEKYNVKTLYVLVEYILQTIERLYSKHLKELDVKLKSKEKKVYKENFYSGAILAINEKFTIQQEENKEEFGEAKINDLMVIKNNEIDKRVDELFPPEQFKINDEPVEDNIPLKEHDLDAYYYGYKAGKDINLHKGLTEQKKRKTIT